MTYLLNKNHVFAALLAACLLLPDALAARESLPEWLSGFRKKALSQGISEETFDRAFENFEVLDDVVELDRKQPESTKTFDQYVETVVSSRRIDDGKKVYRQHKKLLKEIGDRYGVPPGIIVALWGIETNYGNNTGDMPVIDSLATLAYDGRRRDLFEGELLNALKIVDGHEMPLQRMEGSWAGAMGQCQFMPSSYLKYAVDYDRDGKRDIWDTQSDVFASIANYLSESGWDRYETWGTKASLNYGFGRKFYDTRVSKTIDGWRREGAEPLSTHLPRPDSMLEVFMPDAEDGTGYLVTANYKVLLQWNRSRYFATSVGLLADAIEQEE